MPVHQRCPHCAATVSIPSQNIGKVMKCGHCQRPFLCAPVAVAAPPPIAPEPVELDEAEPEPARPPQDWRWIVWDADAQTTLTMTTLGSGGGTLLLIVLICSGSKDGGTLAILLLASIVCSATAFFLGMRQAFAGDYRGGIGAVIGGLSFLILAAIGILVLVSGSAMVRH